jgi:hypothetical protein
MLAAIMGINKAGDIQYLFMPTIIPNAFTGNRASVIVGNTDDSHSKPSFIFTDTTDLGSVYVIETYDSILDEIRPGEPLPFKILAYTSWAKPTVPFGLAGNVANMLATCRPDRQMWALLANISLLWQHKSDPDTVFLCWGLPTFTPFFLKYQRYIQRNPL